MVEKEINWMDKTTSVMRTARECRMVTKNGYIKEMSKTDLKVLYNKIEGALIDYNHILKIGDGESKNYVNLGKGDLGKYLESKLFEVVLMAYEKDPDKKLLHEFRESFWADKLKDRTYYNEISNMAGIPDHKQYLWYEKVTK